MAVQQLKYYYEFYYGSTKLNRAPTSGTGLDDNVTVKLDPDDITKCMHSWTLDKPTGPDDVWKTFKGSSGTTTWVVKFDTQVPGVTISDISAKGKYYYKYSTPQAWTKVAFSVEGGGGVPISYKSVSSNVFSITSSWPDVPTTQVKSKGQNLSFVVTAGFRSKYKDRTAVITEKPAATLPSISWLGHEFLGWLSSSSGVTYPIGTVVHGSGTKVNPADTTYTGQWKLSSYTISYSNMTGATAGTYAPTSASYDEEVTISAPTKAGSIFSGWNITGMDSNTHVINGEETTATSITESTATKFKNLRASSGTVTFEAVWTQTGFKFNPNYTGAPAIANMYFSPNDTISNLPTPTRTGYTFKGWWTESTGGTQITNGMRFSYNTLVQLYAHWEANSYTIKYILNGGTAGSSAPTSANFDEIKIINNPSKIGYTFDGWTYSNGTTSTAMYGTSSSTVVTAWSNASTKVKEEYFKNLRFTSGEVTLIANWSVISYTATFTVNGGTWGTGGTGNKTKTYTIETALTAPDTVSKTGSNFSGWKATSTIGGWVADSVYTNFPVGNYGNITFNADWGGVEYILTAVGNGGIVNAGSVTGWTQSGNNAYKKIYYNNAYGDLPEATRENYTFIGWFTSATGGVEVTKITKMIAANVSIYAHWAPKSCYVYKDGWHEVTQIWVYTGTWREVNFNIYNNGWKQGLS